MYASTEFTSNASAHLLYASGSWQKPSVSRPQYQSQCCDGSKSKLAYNIANDGYGMKSRNPTRRFTACGGSAHRLRVHTCTQYTPPLLPLSKKETKWVNGSIPAAHEPATMFSWSRQAPPKQSGDLQPKKSDMERAGMATQRHGHGCGDGDVISRRSSSESNRQTGRVCAHRCSPILNLDRAPLQLGRVYFPASG